MGSKTKKSKAAAEESPKKTKTQKRQSQIQSLFKSKKSQKKHTRKQKSKVKPVMTKQKFDNEVKEYFENIYYNALNNENKSVFNRNPYFVRKFSLPKTPSPSSKNNNNFIHKPENAPIERDLFDDFKNLENNRYWDKKSKHSMIMFKKFINEIIHNDIAQYNENSYEEAPWESTKLIKQILENDYFYTSNNIQEFNQLINKRTDSDVYNKSQILISVLYIIIGFINNILQTNDKYKYVILLKGGRNMMYYVNNLYKSFDIDGILIPKSVLPTNTNKKYLQRYNNNESKELAQAITSFIIWIFSDSGISFGTINPEHNKKIIKISYNTQEGFIPLIDLGFSWKLPEDQESHTHTLKYYKTPSVKTGNIIRPIISTQITSVNNKPQKYDVITDIVFEFIYVYQDLENFKREKEFLLSETDYKLERIDAIDNEKLRLFTELMEKNIFHNERIGSKLYYLMSKNIEINKDEYLGLIDTEKLKGNKTKENLLNKFMNDVKQTIKQFNKLKINEDKDYLLHIKNKFSRQLDILS